MNMTSIGDLAQNMMLRHRSVQIKQTIGTLTDELSSGRVSDLSARLKDDFSYLTDIDRNLARLEAFSVASKEAAFFADASQVSIGQLHELSTALSGSLISFNAPTHAPLGSHIALQARGNLDTAISLLNSSTGGRSLFAGTATDRAPLASADVMLGELETIVSGLGSSAAIETAVADWFADPSGFRAVMYSGSDDTLAPIRIGQGQEVALTLKADDQAFQDLLQNLALVAMAGDESLGFGQGVQDDLFETATEGLLNTQDKLAAVRSDLGFAQFRIEETTIRNASARTGLEYSKGSLLEADPFETAIRLEEAQFQLESLYAVTVRSSQLSLLNFMR